MELHLLCCSKLVFFLQEIQFLLIFATFSKNNNYWVLFSYAIFLVFVGKSPQIGGLTITIWLARCFGLKRFGINTEAVAKHAVVLIQYVQ